MQDRKMQDWKMTDKSVGLGNAAPENGRKKCKAVSASSHVMQRAYDDK